MNILKTLLLIAIFSFYSSANVQSQTIVPKIYESSPIVNVIWNKNTETNILGYYLDYGTTLGEYPSRVTVNENKCILPPLVHAKTYYIVVRAFNSLGNVSEPSDPIGAKILDKNFPVTPTSIGIVVNNRFLDIQQSTDGGKTYKSIGLIPYPSITGQKYKTLIQAKDPIDGKRYIQAFMSVDAGVTYNFIGKVAYPVITGQKYKTSIYIKTP